MTLLSNNGNIYRLIKYCEGKKIAEADEEKKQAETRQEMIEIKTHNKGDF